ncbi:MAG: hypothetical protein IT536_05185 [Hyphomicrobiales bacterium]|nr:hypothetical protein [Hyphomicrobiales bacterium]
MIRFLLRFLGLLALALAFIFFVYDGTKSIADQRWYITKVAEVWATLHESSLTQVRPMLEGFATWLWDPVAINVLDAPIGLVLVLVGIVLVLLGRKRRPLIGYARR